MSSHAKNMFSVCAYALMTVCTIALCLVVGLKTGNFISTHSIVQIQDDVEAENSIAYAQNYYGNYPTIDNSLLTFLSSSPFARNEVIQYMVNDYVSELSEDTLMIDRLETAIEAMQLVEEDGEPVQINGYDYLFVGSVGETYIGYPHYLHDLYNISFRIFF